MVRSASYFPAVFALAAYLSVAGISQNAQAAPAPGLSQQTGSSGAPDSLPPLSDPATVGEIREFLRLSGDMDSLRIRWIASLDKNRALGAPYWPESFWTAIKDEMRNTDLLPMYITLFQHDVSRDLMQEVLETYHRLGVDHFQGSPACFKLGDPKLGLAADMDKLKLAKTQEVVNKVYAVYKPQIKAARLKYQADHPGWVDK
jgi:hypothetical protein